MFNIQPNVNSIKSSRIILIIHLSSFHSKEKISSTLFRIIIEFQAHQCFYQFLFFVVAEAHHFNDDVSSFV